MIEVKKEYSAKNNLNIFYKILTGHEMDEEQNPVIKEHFLSKCKEIARIVVELRLKTGLAVIKNDISSQRLQTFYDDSLKKINEYETSKEK